MLLSIISLAFALNLEPTRWAIVPLLLASDKPRQHLMAFALCSIGLGLCFGFFAILGLDAVPQFSENGMGQKIQIAAGLLAISLAAVISFRSVQRRKQSIKPSERPVQFVHRILEKGLSPRLTGLLGIGIALPSIDYLAVLTVIGTSGTPVSEKIMALVLFVLLGSLVIIVPLIGVFIAPEKTATVTARLREFVLSRSAWVYAAILAVAGCLFIWFGTR